MDLEPSMWLARVRAVPAVALKCAPTYESASEILILLRPLLLRWTSRAGELKVTTEALQVRAEDREGFVMTVSHDNAAVGFGYKATLLDAIVTGADLVHAGFEFSAPVRPVREILQDCEKQLLEVMSELQKVRKRDIERVGVVVSGVFDPRNPAPGFVAFLQHLVRPWQLAGEGAATDHLSEGKFALRVDLSETDETIDRCIHGMEWKTDTDEKLGKKPTMQFRLDWQRWLNEARGFTQAQLTELLRECDTDAFSYFGKFGIGDLQYD